MLEAFSTAWRWISGPRSTSLCRPLPTVSAAMRSAKCSTKASWIDSCTRCGWRPGSPDRRSGTWPPPRPGRLLGIHVRADDEGRVAAQLQRDALDGTGALLEQQPPHPRGTGEGQCLDALLLAQDRGHLGGLAQHHIEDTSRDTGPLGQLSKCQRRERRLAGGLDDHRATGGHGGGGLAGDHRQRESSRA